MTTFLPKTLFMNIHLRAGKKTESFDLINIAYLISQYYILKPDINNPDNLVKFGTSGHRGSSEKNNFNETHILSIAQSIVDVRKKNGIKGPCFVGKDTHALSEPAMISVISVLIANNVKVIIQQKNGYTPTPVISYFILEYNKNNKKLADGIIITPSHNPPEYGGIKYNSPLGGPANTFITKSIEDRANFLIKNQKKIVYILPKNFFSHHLIKEINFIKPYVKNLCKIINLDIIKKSKIKVGIDPLGGASLEYWKYIIKYYKLNFKILNNNIDQTFRFINLDYDGLLRMDCSSKYTVSKSILLRKNFKIICSNDPDSDRYGIITPKGLMESNHYFIVAIDYLFNNRKNWNKKIGIGKTIVSSAMIDKVVHNLGRNLVENPVGFKWFVDDLYNKKLGFCGEESAGASFLKFDGNPWSTDKDGIILCLLAAEITAVTKKNPQQYYNILVKKIGKSSYNRLQFPISLHKKNILLSMFKNFIPPKKFLNDPIISYIKEIPNKNIKIEGIKLITKNGWFAIRLSGTENFIKIYCESFINDKHRIKIEKEIQQTFKKIFKICS